jgi:hypothetical protein
MTGKGGQAPLSGIPPLGAVDGQRGAGPPFRNPPSRRGVLVSGKQLKRPG